MLYLRVIKIIAFIYRKIEIERRRKEEEKREEFEPSMTAITANNYKEVNKSFLLRNSKMLLEMSVRK